MVYQGRHWSYPEDDTDELTEGQWADRLARENADDAGEDMELYDDYVCLECNLLLELQVY